MVAGRAGGLPRPEPREDGERLVELLGARAPVGRLADRTEATIVERAEAYRQDQPPAGEPVDGRRLTSHLPRPAARERVDDRAERDALGDHGHRAHERERVLDRDVVADMDAVPGKDAVPAGGFRGPSKVDLLPRVASSDDDPVPHAVACARAAYCCGVPEMFTSQGMPNRSVSMPNWSPHGALTSGSMIVPPSLSFW